MTFKRTVSLRLPTSFFNQFYNRGDKKKFPQDKAMQSKLKDQVGLWVKS